MRRPVLLLAALLLPSGLALAQPAPAPAPTARSGPGAENPVLARVDGAEIRLSDLREELGRLPDQLRGVPQPTLVPLLLDQLITQKAITTAARRRRKCAPATS